VSRADHNDLACARKLLGLREPLRNSRSGDESFVKKVDSVVARGLL